MPFVLKEKGILSIAIFLLFGLFFVYLLLLFPTTSCFYMLHTTVLSARSCVLKSSVSLRIVFKFNITTFKLFITSFILCHVISTFVCIAFL